MVAEAAVSTDGNIHVWSRARQGSGAEAKAHSKGKDTDKALATKTASQITFYRRFIVPTIFCLITIL